YRRKSCFSRFVTKLPCWSLTVAKTLIRLTSTFRICEKHRGTETQRRRTTDNQRSAPSLCLCASVFFIPLVGRLRLPVETVNCRIRGKNSVAFCKNPHGILIAPGGFV